jgi:2-polyprenyl-3-methyl-5-hydroxy-6-metoxy-1,4-benzoquinol methylase
MNSAKCRFCETPLRHTFANLGMSPLSNAFLKQENLNQMEPFYPLHAFVCENCFLVQLSEFQSPEQIFGDYAYFSSYSESWLNHAKRYTELMIERFGLDSNSQVVEIASNDGYLLQYFMEKNIPVLGIEPAKNVADFAKESGIPTIIDFFGKQLATELSAQGKCADLLIGNNVLAHVPDLNDFVAGMKLLLKPKGFITAEFPHLMRLMEESQFDTIYHEHFSYYSFLTAIKIFDAHDLEIFDVDELFTHGGSLRVYACHAGETRFKPINSRVRELIEREKKFGLDTLEPHLSFNQKVRETKRNILSFLIKAKDEGKAIVGYGAPAKGNTLLNYCGIGPDFITYTVDLNPHKQKRYLPGTHIPIYHPDKIKETKPDYLVILPWNLKNEIMEQMAYIRDWSGQFITLIPEVRIYL